MSRGAKSAVWLRQIARNWNATVGRTTVGIDDAYRVGYTLSMKTAVSIPNEVFEEAERLARRMRRSRSEVYSRALAEYVARHVPDRVTEAMDRALDEINEPPDQFTRVASRRVLQRSRW